MRAEDINVVDLLSRAAIIASKAAIETIESRFKK